MKAGLRWFWGVFRTFWWVLILVAVAVLGIGFLRRRNRKDNSEIDDVSADEATSLVEIATQRIQNAVTDVKVEQAIIKTQSEEERKELEEIRKEPDGEKRRKKLSSRLKSRI